MNNGTEIYFDGELVVGAFDDSSMRQQNDDITNKAETIIGTVYTGKLEVKSGTLNGIEKYNINKKVLIL